MQKAVTFWNNINITESAFTIILAVGIVAGWLMSWLASPANVLASAVVLAAPLMVLWRHPVRQSRPELWFALMATVAHLGAALYLLPLVLQPYISTGRSDIPGIIGGGKSLAALLINDSLGAARLFAVPVPTAIYWVSCLFSLLAGGSENAVWILFAWFSALGAFYFLKAFKRLLPDQSLVWYAAVVFFFPSLVLWSSLPSKDAITFWGIGLLTFGVSTYCKERSWAGLLKIAVAEAAIFSVRRYFAVFYCLPLIVISMFDLYALWKDKNYRHLLSSLVFLFLHVAWFGLLVANSFFLPLSLAADYQATASQMPGVVSESDIRPQYSLSDMLPSSSSDLLPLVVKWLSFAAERVWYVFTVLFRPLPWEAHNVFAMFAALENVVLLLLSLLVFVKMQVVLSRVFREPFLLFVVAFITVYVSAFSLQVINLGTMSRMKAPILPMLFFFIVLAAGQFQSLSDVVRMRIRMPRDIN